MVIVVAGVYGLAQVRDNLVLELFPSGTPASNGPGSSGGGGQAPTLNGQSVPSVAVPPGGRTGSATAVAGRQLLKAPKAQSTPTPSASDSSTPTDTPTPVPTDTTVPTSPAPAPTDTASSSAVSLGALGHPHGGERRTRQLQVGQPVRRARSRQLGQAARGVTTGQPG